MFKFRRTTSPENGDMTVEATLSARSMVDNISVHAEARLFRQIIDELTKMFIEKHGAELIDKINPEDVEKHIKTKLAERILDK